MKAGQSIMKIYIKANDDYGFDSNGEAIDESTVNEMYRIAGEILDQSELAQLDPYVTISEDSFKYYATGTAWGAYLAYTIMTEISSDDLDLRKFYTDSDDSTMFIDLDGNGEVKMQFNIYVSNGNQIQVEITGVDVYENGRYTEYFDKNFYKLFDVEKICNHVKRLAEPVVNEIHSTLSNI